jgi:hypothetical protein
VRTAGSPAAISVSEDGVSTTAVTLGLSGLNYGPGGGSDETGQTLTYTLESVPSYVQVFLGDGVTPVAAGATLGTNGTGLAALRALKYKTVANASGGPTNLTWTVTDSGSGTPANVNLMTDSLSITVNPVNDAPSITSSATASAPEGSTTALTVVAVDPDSTTLTYSLVGGADLGKFSIDPSTGVLSFLNPPNFEAPDDAGANRIYDVQVRVSDGTLTDTRSLAIALTNLAPSVLDADVAQNVVFKNIATGAAVGVTAFGSDPAGGTVTLSLINSAGGRFALNPSTGVITVANGSLIDVASSVSSYQITIQASDGTTASSTNLTIQVENRGVNLAGTTATFVWESVPGAVAYDVWVQDLTTGQNPVVRNSQAVGNSWTSSTPLVAGRSYRWWLGSYAVAPWVAPTTPTWSAPLDFTVAAAAVSVTVPTPSSPATTTTTDRPTFTWASPISGAAGYDIWVDRVSSTGATLQSQVLRFSTSTGSTTSAAYPLAAAALTPGQSYRWWVRTHFGGSSYSAWSSAKDFSIAALAAPTAGAPTSGTLLTTDRPTFTWNPVSGAASYDLWLDRVSGSGATLQSQFRRITIAGGLSSHTLTALQALTPGSSYRWWVGAVSSNGQVTTWSVGQIFTVTALAAPVATAPNMTSTSAGSAGTVSTTTPTFSWNSVGSMAAYYDIWVDDVTTSTVVSQVIRMYADGTQTSWTVNGAGSSTNPPAAAARRSASLISGHKYRYWIGAVSANGTEVWSTAYYFKVA